MYNDGHAHRYVETHSHLLKEWRELIAIITRAILLVMLLITWTIATILCVLCAYKKPNKPLPNMTLTRAEESTTMNLSL